MERIWKLFGILAIYGLVGWKLGRSAIDLLNTPNTVKVMSGLLLIVLMITLGLYFAPIVIRLIRGTGKDLKREVSNKNTTTALACFIALSSTGCWTTRIDAGHVGIKVNLSGDQRGVDQLPIQTGWVWYGLIGEQVFEYPTFMQTVQWTKDLHEGKPVNEEITFTTKEGLVVTADISLSYQLVREKIPDFYVKFRTDKLEDFTHGFLRNVTRDQFNETASKFAIESIVGDNEAFIAEVRKRLAVAVQAIGVDIQQFGFIGAPRPPQNVIDAINSKIGATQRAIQVENELRQAEAEAKKAVAKAEGEAKAAIARAEGEAAARRITADSEAYTNVTVTKTLSPSLSNYLHAKKWDGHLPQVTGGANPFVSLSENK